MANLLLFDHNQHIQTGWLYNHLQLIYKNFEDPQFTTIAKNNLITLKEMINHRLFNYASFYHGIRLTKGKIANELALLEMLYSLYLILIKEDESHSFKLDAINEIQSSCKRLKKKIFVLQQSYAPYMNSIQLLEQHIDLTVLKIRSIPLKLNITTYIDYQYYAHYFPKANAINCYYLRKYNHIIDLILHEIGHLLIYRHMNSTNLIPIEYDTIIRHKFNITNTRFKVEMFCDHFSQYVQGRLKDQELNDFFDLFIQYFRS